MWFALALFSAILLSFRRVGEKGLSTKLNHFTIGWVVQLLSLPFMLIALVVAGSWLNPLELGSNFWLPLIVIWLVIYPLNTIGYFKALKSGQLSKVLPVHSLIPAMSLLLAWAVLGEVPSVIGILGVFLIVLGVYVVNMAKGKLHNPFRPFIEDKSTLFMLLSAISIAVGGILDKVAVRASEPLYYNVFNTIGAVLVLFVLARLLGGREKAPIRKNMKSLLTVGTLQGVAYTAYLVAISIGPVAYVVSIRSGNVLIGSLLGALLLKEAITKEKIWAFILILAGFVLLAFS